MKTKHTRILSIILIIAINYISLGHAWQGNSGYEGGISSGYMPDKTRYDYEEVVFISGEPIVMRGTVTVQKSLRTNTNQNTEILTTLYNYDLRNVQKNATLRRTLNHETTIRRTSNGQVIETTKLTGNPVEIVRIGNIIYNLRSYDYTSTNIVDRKPAINYYSGNIIGKKTYAVNGLGSGSITVQVTGEFFGYNQYWGSTEAQVLNYVIEADEIKNGVSDKWGGTARVNLSTSTTKKVQYIENRPDVISFSGGYVQNQYNNSVLEFRASLPEFDSRAVSTDRILEKRESLQIESFPTSERLIVPNTNHLRGHWAENDVKALYSLEIFKGDASTFIPEQLMRRDEFAAAIVNAAKEVPIEPVFQNNRNANGNTTATNNFIDVEYDNQYSDSINEAYRRGLLKGRGNSVFSPEDYLIMADAIVVLIHALGLEALAPQDAAVTTFLDNDQIPSYARRAVYVAQNIGLVVGDERGYLNPMERLTKARASVIINKLIDYMREGIRQDYRERILNY